MDLPVKKSRGRGRPPKNQQSPNNQQDTPEIKPTTEPPLSAPGPQHQSEQSSAPTSSPSPSASPASTSLSASPPPSASLSPAQSAPATLSTLVCSTQTLMPPGSPPMIPVTNSSRNILSKSADSVEPKRRGRKSKTKAVLDDVIYEKYGATIKDILVGNTGDVGVFKFGINSENHTVVEPEDPVDPVDAPAELVGTGVSGNYLFQLKTVQTSTFKALVSILQEMLVEAQIECTPTYMTICERDSNHKIMIYLILYGKEFESYYCEKAKLNIDINLGFLHKITKSLDNDSTFSLFVDRADTKYLGAEITNKVKGTCSVSKIPLLDIGTKKQKMITASLSFDAVIVINSDIFQRIFKDMKDLSTEITITAYCKDGVNRLILGCNEDASKDEKTVSKQEIISQTDGMKFIKVPTEIIKDRYAINDIQSFISKCTNMTKGETIRIYMKNKSPLVLKYDIGKLGSIALFANPVR